MTRILKTNRPLANKTPREGQTIAKPWFSVAAGGVVRSKASVKRLMQKGIRDPLDQTGATEHVNTRDLDQFTTNPNDLYDPSKSPGAVKIVKKPVAPVGTSGHGGKITQPNTRKLQGKLKRR